MGTLVKTIAITAAKKAANVNPSDFITQDNVSTIVNLVSHVIKLLF